MIVSHQQLQQMIDEEFARAVVRRKQLVEGRNMRGGLYEVEAYELLEFCKAYASLGAAVQEQVDDVLDNSDNDDVNPNAIRLAQEHLGGMNSEIDDAFDAYHEYREGPSSQEPQEETEPQDGGDMDQMTSYLEGETP
jgi:hypothetical protein